MTQQMKSLLLNATRDLVLLQESSNLQMLAILVLQIFINEVHV